MKRCVIITALVNGDIMDLISLCESDFIVCADGGYDIAKRQGIKPDLVIGDMDSRSSKDEIGCEERSFAPEKDDTDTALCYRYAVENGFESVAIIGGLAGRLSHTLANISILAQAAKDGVDAFISDGGCQALALRNGSRVIKGQSRGIISVFSLTESCVVTERGLKYPLDRYLMINTRTIGVSNEFIEGQDAEITAEEGTALILIEKESGS